jgi:hypothetical protein
MMKLAKKEKGDPGNQATFKVHLIALTSGAQLKSRIKPG